MYTSFDNNSLVKIVTLLKSHRTEYLSGQDISEALKLSRAAVWKHIKKLERLGYKIDSKAKLGYRLTKKTELLLPWEIVDGLKTQVFGKRAYYFDVIDSTQKYAVRLAKKPEENGSLIVSEKQTHGRGRIDRKWVSPSGGIWMSLVLQPNFEILNVTLFPLLASLAVAIAIEKSLKLKPKLKWPNDVTLRGKKVAGMLVDASVESDKIEYLVLGIGINFKINPEQIDKKIKSTENYYGVTTLTRKNDKSDPIKFVQILLYELENIYRLILNKNYQQLIREWTKRSSIIGKKISVSTPTGAIKGKVIQVDYDGALVLSSKGVRQRILVGDVG
ncbi:MAG: biotin--[acetyl-CoA-carboxylase] ligase [Thaumarchaeota archaeon]|nr:biotin--[acetyl-CoA-carboxylase] ligase [Nitrososphaerota archaeon]